MESPERPPVRRLPVEGFQPKDEMKVILNSRTIIGPQHAQAATFFSEWTPFTPVDTEWLESPSARCVLGVEIAEDEQVVLQGTIQSLDGHNAAHHLEIELRENLGLPPYRGDDPDESEFQSGP